MPTDRFVSVRRDPDSGEVLAHGGDARAHSILQRAGFLPVVRLHQTYHRAPAGLTADEEDRRAVEAVARLRSGLVPVGCDPDFETERRPPHYPTLGGSVAHLAERITEATTTEEAAEVVVELTAPEDGVLDGLAETLEALAAFHDDLGGPADTHVAARLRYLVDDHLRAIRTDLLYTRTALADQHTAHPARRECTGQVPDHEHERSALCACPPPTRLPSPAPAPVSAAPRR
ncbi:hypothetical protein [Streptomyces sp. GZWMJZ-114]|uniref:hypothetical protein n=1 Tax=Streptomyces sp. GZWMJZ-114 TaxID=2494734 RepID=UPI0010117196|nr:hypothetical protein [Streptomyces sp. GZWMJZ-114]